MINKILDFALNEFSSDRLKFFELLALALFLIFLPSFEAPKNIFLFIFTTLYFWRSIKLPKNKWMLWDWIFLLLILSAFLSAQFSGIPGGFEWKGFRAVTSWILFGWILSRTDYNLKEKYFLFVLSIFAALPPLLWGFIEHYFFPYSNGGIKPLTLHSVGHVNHSAIYLCLIFGASISFYLTAIKDKNKIEIFLGSIFFILFFLSLIIGQSRGAYGISILLAFILVISSSIKSSMKVITIFVLAIIISSTIIYKAPIVQKHEGYVARHDTLSLRDSIWRASIEASRLYPIFGVGNGNASKITYFQIKSNVEARGEFFNPDKYEIPIVHPHNIYLANLLERGLFGFLVFIGLLTLWAITILDSYIKKFKNSKEELLFYGSFSSFFVIFGTGLVNTSFHHENALLALFFLGLHLSLLRQKNQFKLFS